MPDPSNLADVPPSWRPEATQPTPMPPAKAHAIARKIKNRRHALVLALATKIEDDIRASGVPHATALEVLEQAGPRWWKRAAATVGHDSTSPPSEVTRAAVIEKLRADLAAPYRAKGR